MKPAWLDALAAPPPLREINFWRPSRVRGPSLARFSAIPSLRYLRLRGFGFGDHSLPYLKDLRSLRRLSLSRPMTTQGGLESSRITW